MKNLASTQFIKFRAILADYLETDLSPIDSQAIAETCTIHIFDEHSFAYEVDDFAYMVFVRDGKVVRTFEVSQDILNGKKGEK